MKNSLLSKIENLAQRLVNLTAKNRLLKFPKIGVSVLFSYSIKEFQNIYLSKDFDDLVVSFDHKIIDEAINLRNDLIKLEENQENISNIENSKIQIIKKIENLELPKVISPKIENIKPVLNKLRLESKKKLEEKGLKTLFISFGSVSWSESSIVNNSEKHFDSPLILFPVDIEIDNKSKKTKVTSDLSEREVIFNPILDIYLKKLFNNTSIIKIDDQLSIEENLIAIKELVADTLKSENIKYDFTDNIRLTEYYFPSQFIYEELTNRKEFISRNDIIESLIEGKDFTSGSNIDNTSEIDVVKKVYENDLNVLNSDVTQDASIFKSLNQKFSVIQGPPGTGKSQTIVNLISNIVGSGKTVLFVCEKRAALEVVHSRLKKVGLDTLCLPLFNSIKSKRNFYTDILEKYNQLRKNKYELNSSEKFNRKLIAEKLHVYSDTLRQQDDILKRPLYEIISEKAVLKNKVSTYIEWDNSIKIKDNDSFVFLKKFLENYSKYFENISLDEYKKLNFINKKFITNTEELKLKKLLVEINQNIDFLNNGLFCKKFSNFENIKNIVNLSEKINIDNLNYFDELGSLEKVNLFVTKIIEIDEKFSELRNDFNLKTLLSYKQNKFEFESVEILDNLKIDQNFENLYTKFSLELDNFNTYVSLIEDNIKDNIDVKNFLEYLNLFKFIDSNIDINKITKFEKLDDFKKRLEKIKVNKNYLENKILVFETNYGFEFDKCPDFILETLGKHKSFSLTKFLTNKNYRNEVLLIKKETNISNFNLIFGKFEKFIEDYKLLNVLKESGIKEQHDVELFFYENFNLKLSFNKIYGLVTEITEYSKYNDIPDSVNKFFIENASYSSETYNSLNSLIRVSQFMETNFSYKLDFSSMTLKSIDLFLNSNLNSFTQIKQKIVNSNKEILQILDGSLLTKEFIRVFNLLVYYKDEFTNLGLSQLKFDLIKENFEFFINFVHVNYSLFEILKIHENSNENLHFLTSLLQNIKDNKNEILKSTNSLEKQISELKDLLNINQNLLVNGSLEKLQEKIINIDEKINYISEICKINSEREEFISRFKTIDFIDKVCFEIVSIRELQDTVLLSYYDFNSNNNISNSNQSLILDTNKHKIFIEDFKNSERSIIKSNPYFILDKFKQNIISKSGSLFSISNVERQANLQKKHQAIRKFLKDNGMDLLNILPCWIASPSNIANYSEIGSTSFDYVIFDEASQIKVEQAIGAIARGTNVIVIGDSKQMPPTDFFEVKDSSDDEYDENEEETRFESILDSANAVFSKMSTMLKYHYRSKHPELIEFSNVKMYNSELITFPSNSINPNPIEFIYVDEGVFDGNRKENGNTIQGKRNNEIEARKVAEKCYEIARDFPLKSIGVVTFNQKQEDEIRNQIEEIAKESEEFSKLREILDEQSDNYENFFIKNLETVQGDERDIIIMSVTYGKNKSGKVTQRFGPLTSYNGKRRLNVAISRAKEKMIIFSSLKFNEINVSDSDSPNLFFQQFLEFAEKGSEVLFASKVVEDGKNLEFDSPFEEQVWGELTNKGYKVDTQIGSLGFKIDLAIQNPNGSDYILGIECDGRKYHSSYIAKTNDRVRQEILEKAGWEIFRIYSLDWFNNKELVLNNIDKRVQRLIT